MDSVTQATLGAAIGGAVAHRQLGWRAYAAGALLGTLPDLDILIRYDNAVDNVTRHRGFSHSLFVLTLLAPALTGFIYRVSTYWRSQLSWRQTFFLCWLVFISHVALDAFTSYGTQLFWPLASPPVSISSIFIIDPFYTVPLLLGVCLAIALRRSHAPARGIRANHLGLAISSLYLATSLVTMLQVRGIAEQALVNQQINGRVFVSPTPFNIMLWRVVAVDSENWYSGYFSVLDPQPEIPLQLQAKRNLHLAPNLYAVRRIDWFTHGFFSLQEKDQRLILTDLRLGVEPFLPFQFLVAEHSPQAWKPMPSVQLRQPRPDRQALRWIWHRIQSPEAGLPSNFTAKN